MALLAAAVAYGPASAGTSDADGPALLAPHAAEASPVPPPAALDPSGLPELVTEFYPDGRVRLERTVIRGVGKDVVNHGAYVLYAADGTVQRRGHFVHGRQQGSWMQVLRPGDPAAFAGDQGEGFTGPFISVADFDAGKLDGLWVVQGGAQQPIVRWQFRQGRPEGTWTWWYPNGELRREMTFVQGRPTGPWREWDAQNVMSVRAEFVDGRPVVRHIEWHAPGRKRCEGTHHLAGSPSPALFDWWTNEARLPAPREAQPLKHGLWTTWHPNGQKEVEGLYDQDLPSGRFTWWYEDGRKQAEGSYDSGLQDGTWTTWHPNGRRESIAEYRSGLMVGRFFRWTEEGQLAESYDFDRDAVAAAPPGPAGLQPHAALGIEPATRQRLTTPFR